MPVYQYTARTEDGALVGDTVAFHGEKALRHHLRQNNLFVVDIAERRRTSLKVARGIGLGDLIILTRQLRTMIQAGMPLVSGLEALAEQSINPNMTAVVAEVARAVTGVRSLSASMAEYPRVFPELLLTFIEAGEQSGRLPEALLEASSQLELQMEMRQKLISALVYPIFTLAATFGTVAAMLIWIVPVFAGIYKDLHATLPGPTRFLIALSDVLVHSTWIVLLTLIAGAVALRRYYMTPEGRLRIDGLKLRIPILGILFRKTASANMTGNLAGLMESGVPLIQALQTASRVCGNALMAQAVVTVAQNVIGGKRLSDEMELSGQFPLMVVRMMAIAEEVGTMPEVLRHIAASYREEVDYSVRRAMGLIEPVMVLVVGAVVGFVLVALYSPIFNLGNAFLAGG